MGQILNGKGACNAAHKLPVAIWQAMLFLHFHAEGGDIPSGVACVFWIWVVLESGRKVVAMVQAREPRFRSRELQNGELLAESEVLKQKSLARTQTVNEQTEEKTQHSEHAAIFAGRTPWKSDRDGVPQQAGNRLKTEPTEFGRGTGRGGERIRGSRRMAHGECWPLSPAWQPTSGTQARR